MILPTYLPRYLPNLQLLIIPTTKSFVCDLLTNNSLTQIGTYINLKLIIGRPTSCTYSFIIFNNCYINILYNYRNMFKVHLNKIFTDKKLTLFRITYSFLKKWQ